MRQIFSIYPSTLTKASRSLMLLLVSALFSIRAEAVITPADVLTAADAANDDRFGWSVSIDGNTAIVGAYLDDDGAIDSGSAYIFVNDGAGNWTQQQKLTASYLDVDDTNIPADVDTLPDVIDDKQREAGFGYSVAVHGDIAVIGAPYYDIDSGDATQDTLDAGAIYIFERSGGVWSEVFGHFTIDPADAYSGDWFGSSVAVYGNTIVVGALSQVTSGQAYILYKDTDGTWKQQYAQQANTALDIAEQKSLQPLNPGLEEYFGQSVAIHKNTIIVGSDGDDNSATGSGSAYVFTRDVNSNWNLQAKLLPSDPVSLGNFGTSVAIDENTVVVGADAANASGTSEGAAYVFNRNVEGGWSQTTKLSASDAASGDKFGKSVSLSLPLVVVGAWNEDTSGTQAGSAYVFDVDSGGTWSELDVVRLGASAFNNFGFSVGVSSIDNDDDYWVVAGVPQLLANDTGEIQITGNIANLVDTDGDTTTNDADTDHDGDSILNVNDAFPYDPAAFSDIDGDGVDDSVDQFPNNPTESADTDGDGIGNNFDINDDGDSASDIEEIALGTDPLVGDYFDTDGDGVVDASDAFPNDPTETLDTDGDGIGNNLDSDDDNDGLTDEEETTLYEAPKNNPLHYVTNPLNSDTDGDGVIDSVDQFPLDPSESVDTDNDLIGDNLDTDDDNDGVTDLSDAFPLDPTETLDTDGDGIGDNADLDADNDGVPDADDDLPLDNTESVDTDGDGIGNNADTDDDADGVLDTADAFPLDKNESVDTDGDGIGNNADTDDDNDGIPDTREILNGTDPLKADTDGDGALDTDTYIPGTVIDDLFPLNPNESSDFDGDCTTFNLVTSGDGCGDNSDPDLDNDGVVNAADAFPLDPTETLDTDGDGIGNNADTDDDNDGVLDSDDAFPLDATESVDTDGDGIGNNADTDDDGDGVADSTDLFPLDSTESADNDGDGIGENADTDDDNDNVPDTVEIANGTDPLNPDTDGDGALDTDTSSSVLTNTLDLFPLNPNESSDSDGDCPDFNLVTSGDGCGDNSDPDSGVDTDGDGVPDVSDAFPLDPTETVDTDGDGIGDNADTDDDGDGIPDSADTTPLGTGTTTGGGSLSPALLLMLMLVLALRAPMIKKESA